MKPIKGKQHSWGVSCDAIGFCYSNEKEFKNNDEVSDMISDWLFDDLEIIGIHASAYPINLFEDTVIAAVDPPEDYFNDYLLIIGNVIKKAEQMEEIRKSKKPVITIAKNFTDFELDQYIAAGSYIIKV